MDFKVSQKEERLQPGGPIQVYIPDVFDLYPIFNGSEITGCAILDGINDIEQGALFASVKQRGSDPLALNDGVRWAECLLGEISSELIVQDIKEAVRAVSTNVNVAFSTVKDANGSSYLMYDIQVVS